MILVPLFEYQNTWDNRSEVDMENEQACRKIYKLASDLASCILTI